jgi:hypothetical protein
MTKLTLCQLQLFPLLRFARHRSITPRQTEITNLQLAVGIH